jgi:transposase-like protein
VNLQIDDKYLYYQLDNIILNQILIPVAMENKKIVKRGKPVTSLTVTTSERAELERRLAMRKVPADMHLRIRIVLSCADGVLGDAIAAQLGTSVQTVCKWRRRYNAYGLEGLADAPRSGRPRTVVEKALDTDCIDLPTSAAAWNMHQFSKSGDTPGLRA